MKAFMSDRTLRDESGLRHMPGYSGGRWLAQEALAEARRIVAETEPENGYLVAAPGQGYHRDWPEADAALADALRAWLETSEP